MKITESTTHVVEFNDEEWDDLRTLASRARAYLDDNYHIEDDLNELRPLFKKLGLVP